MNIYPEKRFKVSTQWRLEWEGDRRLKR